MSAIFEEWTHFERRFRPTNQQTNLNSYKDSLLHCYFFTLDYLINARKSMKTKETANQNK